MSDDVRVWVSPYRFSSNPPAMIEFLQLLGMSPVVTASNFAVLRADAGEVAVHPVQGSDTGAVAGQTQLSFGTTDAEAFAAMVRARGVEATTWDESYGRHAGVVDQYDGGIWINEEQRDLHGYQGHDPHPAEGLTVVAVRYSPDFAADERLFAAFGFTPDGPGDEWWQALRADAHSGCIGLHRPSGEPVVVPGAGPLGDNPVCDLSLSTTEPLDAVRDRLVAAGHPCEIRDLEGVGATLCVTDPDGVALQVHRAG